MIDMQKLLTSKRIEICGNKYFRLYSVVENGISEPHMIRFFGKLFYIPQWLRKRLRHKDRF